MSLLSPPLPDCGYPGPASERGDDDAGRIPTRCLLLIDDEPAQRRLVTAIGARAGWWVRGANDFDAAQKMLDDPQEPKFDAILLDHWLPGEEGSELIRADPRASARAAPARPHRPERRRRSRSTRCAPARAISSSSRSRPTGCSPRSTPPPTAARPRASFARSPRRSPRRWASRRSSARRPNSASALAIAAKAARARVSVLIEGESGSGKEIIAQAIHAASPRGKKQLHTVNCGAIPENLVESVLFGHEKGAFTGAFDRHIGRFEDADGSTLFLDEIGELPLDTQVKLLRALETGEIQRVGSRITQTVDVRIIAATNRRLAEEVAAGRFREDLYYRLNVVHVPIPPLRDRQSDIPALARHLLSRIAEQPGMRHLSITDDGLAVLMSYGWPGNVRQLQNALFRAAVLCEGDALTAARFPADRHRGRPAAGAPTIITPSR